MTKRSTEQRGGDGLRLQVYISQAGVASRRQAMVLIQDGHVSVNGQPVTEPSIRVSGRDDVRVDGNRVVPPAFQYIMMHKPAGYVTTRMDPHAKKTIYDLLPPAFFQLKPVGRLDKDTEGLLLLTNDGKTIQKLTHPRYNVNKTYILRLQGVLKPEDRKRIERGLFIEGRKTAPARVEHVHSQGLETQLALTIHEGRKRQIRNMMAHLGYKVLALKRVRQGPVKLGGLPTGAFRLLTEQEVRELKTG
ncbi:MAG TPA: pseudouridine synthase [Candidatus Omnitrophota bacterium]|nr:rRNA pseudouridine synthase [Candidatus Omnitrophota bacterium]HQO57251.1 pseudouridine synthase [Candidatus Omnitrophota bacterium]HQP11585.1 pseudouridine synthase [Candidatus Omnitrophota bacterium]